MDTESSSPATAAFLSASSVNHPAFDQFVATIAALRAPDGCPWDREQTHASIAKNMIEEAYEAVDAIEAGDVPHLREELGDVLLQVVLQSQIAADAGEFDIDDVCADVNAKMVRRHPHVFGEARAANASEVLDLWDQVKLAERAAATPVSASGNTGSSAVSTSVAPSPMSADAAKPLASAISQPSVEGLLDGIPTSFPALMQAQKISRKAASAGFEWDSLEDVWDKVREEIGELREAYAVAPKAANGKVDAGAAREAATAATQRAAGDQPAEGGSAGEVAPTEGGSTGDTAPAKGGSTAEAVPAEGGSTGDDGAQRAVAAVEEELGDVLFLLVNVGRRMGVDAESALRATCAKFRRRWAFMERAAQADGRRVEELAADEREALWEKAKKNI